MLPRLGVDVHGLLWDPLFQEGQKAPSVLKVGKGGANSKPKGFFLLQLNYLNVLVGSQNVLPCICLS